MIGMANEIIVHKGRSNLITVDLGFDVAGDTLTSEIRAEESSDSDLIATWTRTKGDGGVNGILRLSLDDSVTAAITYKSGFMDIKRVTGTEPVPVFDRPLEVVFRETVTV
jgi:hypothetical protein